MSTPPKPVAPTVPPRFEKLVEWYFVREYLPASAFSSPLAGNHELAGDAIVGDADARFCLIEFKKDESVRATERKKFPAMCADDNADPVSEEACRSLVAEAVAGKRHPHALVFGDYGQTENHLSLTGLIAEGYWGDWVQFAHLAAVYTAQANAPVLTTRELRPEGLPGQIGVPHDAFETYVNRVVAAKGGYEKAGSAGWMYDLVLGLVRSPTGDQTIVMTLWDFARATADSRLEIAFANAHERLAREATRRARDRPQNRPEMAPPAPCPAPRRRPR